MVYRNILYKKNKIKSIACLLWLFVGSALLKVPKESNSSNLRTFAFAALTYATFAAQLLKRTFAAQPGFYARSGREAVAKRAPSVERAQRSRSGFKRAHQARSGHSSNAAGASFRLRPRCAPLRAR
jgi:hypothetical protein